MPTKQLLAARVSNVATLTVSSKFHIVIPKEMRDALGLRPGQRIQAFQCQNSIHLVPVIPMRKARGMFKGIDTDVERERS